MEDNHIYNGFVLEARNTMESDIWTKKPAEWYKIWRYLIMSVNHKDNKFPRGTGFFKYDWIMGKCNVSNSTLDHCIRYLKSEEMITTTKAIHGVVITIINYNTFQVLENYKSDTKKTQDIDESSQRKNLSNIGDTKSDTKSDTEKTIKQDLIINIGDNKNLSATPKATPKAIEKRYKSDNKIQECNNDNNTNLQEIKKEDKQIEIKQISPVTELLTNWGKAFEYKTGLPGCINWGKDGKIIKELLKIYEYNTLRGLAIMFWRSTDKFILNSGYTIGVFKSQIQKLIIDLKKQKDIEEWINKPVEEIKEKENPYIKARLLAEAELEREVNK